jgi:P27 family predicted phage terminase small subunit
LRDIHPGVATTLDRNALARYVVLIDQWKSAMDYIERNGTTFEEKRILGATTKGQAAEIVTVGVREVPHVKQARQIEDQLLKLETAFGLTPSARARLTIPEQEQTKTGAAKYALTG